MSENLSRASAGEGKRGHLPPLDGQNSMFFKFLNEKVCFLAFFRQICSMFLPSPALEKILRTPMKLMVVLYLLIPTFAYKFQKKIRKNCSEFWTIVWFRAPPKMQSRVIIYIYHKVIICSLFQKLTFSLHKFSQNYKTIYLFYKKIQSSSFVRR